MKRNGRLAAHALRCLATILVTACSNDASKDASADDAGSGDSHPDGADAAGAGDASSGGTSDDAGGSDDAGATGDASPSGPTSRDARKWPFASESIWNMPIGDQAQYVAASIDNDPRSDEWTPTPAIEPERIVMHPEAPVLNVRYSDVAWSGGNRCNPSGTAPSWAHLPIQVHAPASYVVENSRHNNGSAFLEPDGRTIIELQPLARCTANGDATALLVFQDFPMTLYGEGAYGSHGGSRLSSLGGTLRIGELLDEAPRHALKFVVDVEYVLSTCSSGNENCRDSVRDECCFRWPAYSSDSGASSWYGKKKPSQPKALKMGSLLAIPYGTSLDSLGLESEPAKMLAWTLQNYGGYVVDATGTGIMIAAEDGADGKFDDGFTKKWGYSFEGRLRDGTSKGKNAAWVRDVQRIVTALNVVANNGPSSVGGGGKPRQPLAPALTAGPP